MIWLAAPALAGLLLVAGPVVVHLLVRRSANRVVFPAMRFVPAVKGAAVRFRKPSDPALLLLRAGAVTAAVLATAQPLLVTPARQRAWADRIARAVIVDTSPSVDASIAQRIADAEAVGASVSQPFTSDDLRDALRRANEWLGAAPAGRREIAIVSDFQAGAIDAADLASIPPATGIRPVRTGPPSPPAATRATVDGWRGGRWTVSTGLEATATTVTWVRQGEAASPTLTILTAPADRVAGERAARAARSFGVPALPESRRIEIAFAGATPVATSPPATPWIVSAAIALSGDPLVTASGAPFAVGERDGLLSARTGIAASSPFAPAVVRAMLMAAFPMTVDREREVTFVDDGTLAAWRRPSLPTATPAPPDANDGRWLWGLALALVVCEEASRRRRDAIRTAEQTHVRAA
jgi:hypothetical protein